MTTTAACSFDHYLTLGFWPCPPPMTVDGRPVTSRPHQLRAQEMPSIDLSTGQAGDTVRTMARRHRKAGEAKLGSSECNGD